MQLLDCNIAYISTRDIDLDLNKLDFTLGSDRVPITIPKKIRDEIKEFPKIGINGIWHTAYKYDFLACNIDARQSANHVYSIPVKSFFWMVSDVRHSTRGKQSCIPVKTISVKKILDDLPSISSKELFEKCIRPPPAKIIRGTDVITCSQSPFAFYCNHFVSDSKTDPHSEDIMSLAQKGVLHEDEIIHDKKQSILNELGITHEDEVSEEYRTMIPVNFKQIQIPTMREKFRICLDEMINKKTESLHDAPLIFFPANMCGRPDILERRKGRSYFGKHHYIVKEVKSAKVITKNHVLQAAFYNLMIGHIQKRYPEKFYIINGNKQEKEYKFEDWIRPLEYMLKLIMDVLQGKTVPEPVYNSTPYPWSEYGNKVAIRQNGVALLGGIKEKRKEVLNQHGYRTISQIAACPESKLAAVPKIGKMAGRIKTHAMAIKCGRAIKKKKPEFPKRETEIFLDFEGRTKGRSIYLAGMLVRKNSNERYVSFVDGSSERAVWDSFVKFLSKQNDHIVYHWSPYETANIKRMGRRYRTPKKLLDFIFSGDNMVDVWKVATSSFAFPTYDNGLKQVAKYVGFRWSQPDINGRNVECLFDEYKANPRTNKQSLQMVLDYNMDDCRATMIVKDWLVRNG